MTDYGYQANRSSRNTSRNARMDRSPNRSHPSSSRSTSRRSSPRPVPGPSRQTSLTFVLNNRPIPTRQFPIEPQRAVQRRSTNFDGSQIIANSCWNDPNASAHYLQEKDVGDGPYRPNYEGANYEELCERIIREAADHKRYPYPPPNLPGTKRFGYHTYGTDNRSECIACFDSHRPVNCKVLALASARRRLAAARSVCILCRTVHKEEEPCPPSNSDYPRCTDPACDGLPWHHVMFCDNTTQNKEVQRQMGLRE